MNKFISIDGYIMDMLIITVYLQGILKRKKKNFRLYYLVLIISEAILFINDHTMAQHALSQTTYFTVIISFIGVFALTMFFDCKMISRLFTAVCFQVYTAISEALFTIIVERINPDFMTITDHLLLIDIMSSGSKVILFIIVLFSGIFWRHKNKNPIEYNALLMITPVISLVIYSVLPLQDISSGKNNIMYTSIILGLLILNIANYFLINRVYAIIQAKAKNYELQRQIQLQNEKYTQLSESYKQSRRIIHDIKKHYFVINELAKEHGVTRISDYLNDAINGLESSYVQYNTGNLVIDSMLTGYNNIASRSGTDFTADVHVNNKRIPVSDYDLSIIIGNLLDNAIKATSDGAGMYIKFLVSTGQDNRFRISCENNIPDKMSAVSSDASDEFDHGYGLSNIRNTVEKYYGFMSCNSGDPWIVNIIIPITSERQSFTSLTRQLRT